LSWGLGMGLITIHFIKNVTVMHPERDRAGQFVGKRQDIKVST